MFFLIELLITIIFGLIDLCLNKFKSLALSIFQTLFQISDFLGHHLLIFTHLVSCLVSLRLEQRILHFQLFDSLLELYNLIQLFFSSFKPIVFQIYLLIIQLLISLNRFHDLLFFSILIHYSYFPDNFIFLIYQILKFSNFHI